MNKQKIILTGFEAFGTHETNPSETLVKELSNKLDSVESIILPVVFKKSFEILKSYIHTVKPDIVLCFGVASDRDIITPECQALNLMDTTSPDNNGNIPQGEKISKNSSNILFSTLNLDIFRDFTLSNTAGSYVCNDLMYRTIEYSHEVGFKTTFIHIPTFEKLEKKEQIKQVSELVKRLEIHS